MALLLSCGTSLLTCHWQTPSTNYTCLLLFAHCLHMCHSPICRHSLEQVSKILLKEPGRVSASAQPSGTAGCQPSDWLVSASRHFNDAVQCKLREDCALPQCRIVSRITPKPRCTSVRFKRFVRAQCEQSSTNSGIRLRSPSSRDWWPLVECVML